ncbi:MAG: hypothetical protein KAI83_03395 [Thiomargarita sp.]|nr:hypothetical protein [Thiomargarita sp.]
MEFEVFVFKENLENASCAYWSTTLQLCAFLGVQRFSFVRLVSNINFGAVLLSRQS